MREITVRKKIFAEYCQLIINIKRLERSNVYKHDAQFVE